VRLFKNVAFFAKSVLKYIPSSVAEKLCAQANLHKDLHKAELEDGCIHSAVYFVII
jgi:hypothetical protein